MKVNENFFFQQNTPEAYGLYIHVPFCRAKCSYCDFYSSGGYTGVQESYIDAILRDFTRYAPCDATGILRPSTIYFGGGTPSLLSAAQVKRLLDAFVPKAGAQITLEANPESATEEKLGGWREAGVNRLSIGVQTAQDESLARLGRLHSARDAQNALKYAKNAGYDSVSGDMMLALPHYSNEECLRTLVALQEGGVQHVSAYLLKVEEGTPLFKNMPALPSDDEAAAFYLFAVGALQKAGYAQYEISNFAQPGHESRHNLLYWDAQNWLGLGPGAHSHINRRRFSFTSDTELFLRDVSPPQEEGILSANDYIMLRLRLVAGMQEAQLYEKFHVKMTTRQRNAWRQFVKHGYARPGEGVWALTPEGMLVQNTILAQLFE